MAADTAAVVRPSRFSRAEAAFGRWRRTRPFWGGLVMIFSGVFLFLSGNLDLGNVQIHLGVPGFLSYIVPAFMILCGALVWASPAQRIFYGVLGMIAAIYSIVSVNFGGFMIGFLLGVVGGGLVVSWVPLKHQWIAIPTQRDGDHGDGLDDDTPAIDSQAIDFTGRHAMNAADEGGTEGKQGARFRFPRPAPDGDPHDLNHQDAPDSRLRTPRFVITGVVALLCVGSIGFVTLRNPQAAAAAGCTLPSVVQLRASAHAKHAPQPASKPKTATPKATTPKKAVTPKAVTPKAVTPKAATAKPASPESATQATSSTASPHAQSSSGTGPIGGLLGGIIKLIGGGTGAPTSPAPTDPPTPKPTTVPTAAPTDKPTPSGEPTAAPTATPTASSAPTGGQPTPHPTGAPAPSCEIIAKHLATAPGQHVVQEKPGTMTAGTLTMTGLSYDGNVDLPTKNGTITVMQFSMDSSTSTPFELDVTMSGHTTRTKSSSLTVSGNVKFYATEIKGNVLGVLPADYTPDNPPPIVPPVLFFTDVTIGLENVVCDKLTGDNLTIN